MGTPRYLIVNGDDFGLCAAVNRGIVRAHDEGILTSTSLMVRYPAAAEAVVLAAARPGLSLGLHLDLGEWIWRDGEWRTLYEVVPVNDPAAVEAEVRRQLQAFVAMVGKNPTHIDSHQHVHRRPELATPIQIMADELQAPLRHFDRVAYCGAFYGQTTEGSPMPQLLSVAALSRVIAELPSGVTELCCHPGDGEDLDQLKTMYRRERKLETDTLCQPALDQVLSDQSVELCSFATMPA